MADRIKGITIEIDGDTTKLSKALQGVDKELRSAQSSLKDVNKLLKIDPGNIELLRQKQGFLNDAISSTEEKLKKEREALEQLKNTPGFDAASKDAQALERQIIADEQALKQLKEESKSFGSVAQQQFQAVGAKVQEIGTKIADVGKSLSMKVTAPITAVGAGAIAAFKDVDAGLDTVTAKTGASGDALADMQERVKSLATSIPTDFQTAGDAIGEVNTRFGLTGDELEELSGKFIKFASLNGTDVSSSIDSVQAAMAAFNMEAHDAGDVLDILNKAGQDTGISVDKLANDLTANAVALQEMGFGINTASGFIANLNKNGIDSSSVMGGLKKALANATKDGKTMGEALAELQDNMANASNSTEAMQAAIDLFGAKAGPQLAAAIQEGRLSFEQLDNAIGNTTNSVENTFAETLDPIDNWTTALNQAKIAGAELGSAIQATLTPIITKLSEVMAQLTEKFRSLSPEQQEMIVKIGLIAAAIGPVLVAIGSVVGAVGKVISVVGPIIGIITKVVAGIGAVITALNPITIVIAAVVAAIAGLIAYFVNLYKTNEEFRAKVQEVWENVKTFISNALENIKTFISNFAAAASEAWKTLWNGIKSVVETVWNVIKTIVTTYINAVKTVITTVLNAIKTVFSTVWNGIKTVVTTVMEAIRSVVGGKVDAVKEKVTNAFNAMKDAVTNIVNNLKEVVFGIFDAIIGKVQAVWDFVSGMGAKIGGALKSITDGASSVSGGDVQSYASAYNNPVMFTKPTVIPTTSGFKKFGDRAGAEVVLGMNKLKELVGNSSMTNNINVVINSQPGQDDEAIAETVINKITLKMQQQGAAFG